MSGSLRQLLIRVLQTGEEFFSPGTLLRDACSAGLRRIDRLVDTSGEAFTSDAVKSRILDLLYAILDQIREWPAEAAFICNEFEELITEIKHAPVT